MPRPYMVMANVEVWAMLNLNPHPLKTEGAAPRSNLRGDWTAG
jgi:hypothetical protein